MRKSNVFNWTEKIIAIGCHWFLYLFYLGLFAQSKTKTDEDKSPISGDGKPGSIPTDSPNSSKFVSYDDDEITWNDAKDNYDSSSQITKRLVPVLANAWKIRLDLCCAMNRFSPVWLMYEANDILVFNINFFSKNHEKFVLISIWLRTFPSNKMYRHQTWNYGIQKLFTCKRPFEKKIHGHDWAELFESNRIESIWVIMWLSLSK